VLLTPKVPDGGPVRRFSTVFRLRF